MAGVKGGYKLESTLAGMAKALARANTVSVGFLEGATYPDGKPVAMIAAIHEFGAPRAGIPARPYFRRMIRKKSGSWGKGIATQLKATNYDAERTLELTGQAIAGQLRESITELQSPALKPATIARKGFEKPLIETGHMLGSVDYQVHL